MNIFTLPTPARISHLERLVADASAHLQATLRAIDLDPIVWSFLTDEERGQVLAYCKAEARRDGHLV